MSLEWARGWRSDPRGGRSRKEPNIPRIRSRTFDDRPGRRCEARSPSIAARRSDERVRRPRRFGAVAHSGDRRSRHVAVASVGALLDPARLRLGV